MQNPLEITFHNMSHNDKVETLILEKFEKVKDISSNVTKCHVTVEKLSRHHQSANASCARLDLKVPHMKDIIISEKCNEDEASLLTAVNKIFKNGKIHLREEVARIRDARRKPKEVSLESMEEDADADEDDGEEIEVVIS